MKKFLALAIILIGLPVIILLSQQQQQTQQQAAGGALTPLPDTTNIHIGNVTALASLDTLNMGLLTINQEPVSFSSLSQAQVQCGCWQITLQ